MKQLVLTILSTLAIVSCGSNTVAFHLPNNVRAEIEVWDTQLAQWFEDNPEYPQDTYEWQDHTAQRALYAVMFNADDSGELDPSLLTPEMLEVVRYLIQGYLIAGTYGGDLVESEPKPGVVVTRRAMRDWFNVLAYDAGMGDLVGNPELVRGDFRLSQPCQGPNCTQYASPNSDGGETGWVEIAGDGDADHFDELDEGIACGGCSPDDATTYWQSSATPSSSEVMETFMTSLTDCTCNTGHIYSIRAEKTSTGGKSLDMIWSFRADGSEIAQQTQLDIDAGWTTYSDTLTAAEADTISDYSTLGVFVWGNVAAGGPNRAIRVSTKEIEIPDAGGVTRRVMIIN